MIVLILAAAVLCFGLLFCLACYFTAFYSPRRGQNNIYRLPKAAQYTDKKQEMYSLIEEMAKIPFEEVSTVSRDGLRLFARYYHVGDGAPLAICFHGYRAPAVRDFCGGAAFLLSHGQNVLLVDQRAQGKSGGHTMTFGIRERYDCLDWIAYAVDRFGEKTKITLYGISMGAATVLMAAGLPLPANVCGVVADCPYSSAEKIIRKVCRDRHLLPCVIYPFIALGALLFGHFRLSQGDVCTSLAGASVPILVIHGEDDHFVPCEMSAEIGAARPDLVQLETFPGAGHGLSFLTDRARYEAIVLSFLIRTGLTADP